MGNNGPSQTDSGKSGVFGKAIDFNAHLFGSRDLKDGLGDTRRSDKGSIGGIKDNDGTTFLAKLDKVGQLFLGGGSTSWVAIILYKYNIPINIEKTV
jgi:hypothetical protein